MAESMAYALYDFIQYVKYARKKQKVSQYDTVYSLFTDW